MASAVSIRPREDTVDSQLGSVAISQIDLGGIPRGAVLLLLGPGGDFESDSTQHLNDLATHGYEGVAADLRGIDGTEDQLESVVESLLAHVARRGWESEQAALLGYGLGGRVALSASARFGLGAAISVSPTAIAAGDGHLSAAVARLAPLVRTPWLGLFGEEDLTAPATACDELETVLREDSPVFTQLVRYPSVGDDFHRPSSESIEIAASYDYWQRTIEWLNLRVQPRLTPLALAWNARRSLS
ncbi:dienelactone hydrolase family protein [Rhodococcus sp. IEGM 1354]|uniref:dienelactone hydrolase family protein n=1 Tax=Rhodococcus sp. IEGM 1354 TaxID=3047088 RepID=UPI0024B690B3|nr:dienelactone hydrolase family protein [Rhodococcus sp. IEGM 1354]MDI9933699.1 dienelactone hydrolase family protein [Rhodococcus sp. IEGM 1354]